MIRVVFYMSDNFACGAVRGIAPMAAVCRQRLGMTVSVKSDMVYSDFEAAEIMVFQRHHSPHMLNWMRTAQSRGIRCIYELDDDLFNIPAGFPELHTAEGAPKLTPKQLYDSPEVRGVIDCFLKEADGVVVSTPELAAAMAPRCARPPVVVLNSVDLPMWEPGFAEKMKRGPWNPARPFVIGWMASGSHNIDAPLVADGIRQVLETHRHVRLSLIGWSGMFDAFTNLQPFKDRVDVAPWLQIGMLPQALATFDVGIAPLTDCPFNRSKSEVKALELGAVGVPCMASPLPCYQRFITEDVGRMVDGNTAADWTRDLLWAVEHPAELWARGINANSRVRQSWNCDERAKEWVRALRM